MKKLVDNSDKLPSLQWIDLRNNQVTDEGLKFLAVNNSKLPNLQHVFLQNNQITNRNSKEWFFEYELRFNLVL